MRFAETGFNLEINLSRGSIDRIPTDRGTVRELLGGQGSAAKLIREAVSPEMDPFSPANLLVFSAGLLNATPVPGANRTSVSGVSPHTNRYLASGFAGFFGTELKHAGYDAIVITGKSPTPVYLLVDNDQVELRDASHLLGKSSLQSAALIQEELKNADLQVAAIGLAGENRVFQATIDHFNSSTSQGLGAIMGDKGLKAIAVRGTRELAVARPAECFRSSMEILKGIESNPRCGDLLLDERDDSLAKAPSAALFREVPPFWSREREEEWALAVESEHVFYQWENYSQEMEEVHETVVDRSRRLRGTGCYNCPKECHHAFYLPGGGSYFLKSYTRLAYALAAYPEVKLNYQLLASMQEYGLDEYSMIQLYAFTARLHEAGVVDGAELPEFPADPAGRLGYLVEKVARREGFGDALAEGMEKAAARLGGKGEAELSRAREAAVQAAEYNEGCDHVDDALGICPLLSSFRAQYGGEPPYHLHNLPQFVAEAAGVEFDAERLLGISAAVRQLVSEINAGRS